MRKICLTVIGLFLIMVHAFSQNNSDTSGSYKNMTLHLEEVNLVSGYYTQNGNHSPVTGGSGTQQLNDISNVIQLKFIRWDIFDKKHTMDIELGVDHHTAASAAYVSKTGASKTGGTRVYPSINWKTENEEKRNSFGWGLAYSGEYNYHSYSTNLNFSQNSRNQNREFSAKAQVYLDRVKMIGPSELYNSSTDNTPRVITSASGKRYTSYGDTGASSIPSSSRNTYDLSLSLTQVVNKKLQIAVLTDAVAQTGYLGLPFHRVYFTDGSMQVEKLPESRVKLPVAARVSYFAGDKFIVRGYYRFYTDNWGVKAHTVSLEVPYKISSFVSASPFVRYYTQSASPYFASYGSHSVSDTYYTSNYEYAAFQSEYAGINFRMAPPKGVLGIHNFNMLEIRAGEYHQTTGLTATNVSMNLRFR